MTKRRESSEYAIRFASCMSGVLSSTLKIVGVPEQPFHYSNRGCQATGSRKSCCIQRETAPKCCIGRRLGLEYLEDGYMRREVLATEEKVV
ncbi:hypothetical protein BDN71DRAFT_1453132, partial [Pleurotus eryngii]